MKKIFFTIAMLVCIGNLAQADIGLAAKDSIGLERKNGRTYILHQVDPSQTLYAIARRYNMQMNLITKANPAVDFNNLRVGQIIRVPYIPSQRASSNNNNVNSYASKGGNQQRNYRQPTSSYSQQQEGSAGSQQDSGKKQIGYMVKSGDSLYRISKRFGMTLEKLKAINQLNSNALQPGQILLVEIEGPALSSGNTANTNNAGNRNAQSQAEYEVPEWAYNAAVDENAEMLQMVHTVQSGENLEQIAFRYNTTADQIRNLNPTVDFDRGMPVGKNILINIRYEPKNPGAATNTYNSNTNAYTGNTASASNNANTNLSRSDIGSRGLPSNRRVKGVGAKITGNTAMESNKHLALHPTATEGTYIKVTNPNNGQYTLVKVIGKLSSADARDNVIIKLSDAACKALGVVDSQFQVILEYND